MHHPDEIEIYAHTRRICMLDESQRIFFMHFPRKITVDKNIM